MAVTATANKSVEQCEYYAEWRFANYCDALSALRHIIEEEVCICSCGSGEDQYDGFMYNEGVLAIKPLRIFGGPGVILTWCGTDDVIPDLWLSPYCFEIDVETYDERTKDARGEACDWGTRKI